MTLLMLRRVMMDIAADERGFTALEYSLITVIIGTSIMACVQTLGASLTSSYTTIGGVLQTLAAAVGT